MPRILLYGGCHATILRNYLRTAFADRFDCTLIVNYELIGSGERFPYSSIQQFDAVLFSPIENKVGYNTNDLVEICERHGIPAICFAWMEWHGYFPGAVKGIFNGHFRWHYPYLLDRAAAHAGDFRAFCEETIADFPDDAMIDAVFEASTAYLRAAERRHGITPAMSDYILRDHREHRLFLVPDHPTRRYYVDVLRAILPRLGVEDSEVERRLLALPLQEPQWRWRLPIFPRVARRLGLGWAGTDWVDDEIFPARTLDLRSYLQLYAPALADQAARSASRTPVGTAPSELVDVK